MKFNHRCECNGCHKSANKRVKNNHWVCDEHFKTLKMNHKKFGHNIFFKEIPIGNIGGYTMCSVVKVKYV